MTSTWVLHTLAFTDDDRVEDLKAEILRRGHNIIECKGAFDHYELDDSMKDVEGPVLAYGSCNFMKWVTSRTNWIHWCDWHRLECTHYMSWLAQHSIHRRYAYITFGELGQECVRKALFANLGGTKYGLGIDTHCMFIRPNSNAKPFHGQVVHYHNSKRWWDEHFDAWKIPPETLCLVSQPRDILAEWRLFIHNGKVISGSKYRPEWAPLEDGEVLWEAEKMLKKSGFDPFPIFSLDLALTSDGQYAIIEYGSINCAGLYAARVEPIVDAMTQEAEKEHDIFTGRGGY